MEDNGWSFNIDVSHRGTESYVYKGCLTSVNPNIPNTWYGWAHGLTKGSISKIFKGNGRGRLLYGNCHGHNDHRNVVKVYLNGVQLSEAGPADVKEVNFYFQENDILKLEESYGIIKVHRLWLNCDDKGLL